MGGLLVLTGIAFLTGTRQPRSSFWLLDSVSDARQDRRETDQTKSPPDAAGFSTIELRTRAYIVQPEAGHST